MVPEEWGWRLQNGRLFPDTTLFPPAPERLLHVINVPVKQTVIRRDAVAISTDSNVLLAVDIVEVTVALSLVRLRKLKTFHITFVGIWL